MVAGDLAELVAELFIGFVEFKEEIKGFVEVKGFVGLKGFVEVKGFVGLKGFVEVKGFVGLKGFVEVKGFVGLKGFVEVKEAKGFVLVVLDVVEVDIVVVV